MFNLNNRAGNPAIKQTLNKMITLFSREQHDVRVKPISSSTRKLPTIKKKYKHLKLLSEPFIIQSKEGSVAHPAPYFEGNNVDFVKEFNPYAEKENKLNCMFFIIANNYIRSTGSVQSHLLLGFFNAEIKELFIIDPNGNDISLDNVYNGEEFKRLSQGAPLQNTLYNAISKVLRYYYDRSLFQLRFYTGDAIICPIGSPANCTYRTVMIMLGFVFSHTLDVKVALEFANYLSHHKFAEVKTLLLKISNGNSNSKSYMNNIISDSSKKSLTVNYFSN